MFYYMYQIKNLLNSKIYVGVHKTKSLDDGYMGSGKIIRSAIGKHGISNFSKVVLEYFEDSESMYAKEAEVVNEEFLLRDDVYNLRRGGHGGFDYLNSDNFNNSTHSKGHILNMSKLGGASYARRMSTDREFARIQKQKLTKRLNDGGSAFSIPKIAEELRRKASTPEAIAKRKETFNKIGHQQGDTNSQSGTMWITNELENKKINKTVLIPEGFRKGRKMKL